MKIIYLFVFLLVTSVTGCSQNKNKPSDRDKTAATIKVGGTCEGCEAIYETPVPFESLNETDTLSDFGQQGPRMEISGIIYQRDGKTPAPGVVMYFYHTDQSGVYPKKGDEKGWAKRHGYLRGWVKTDERGFYHFYTLRPASYPEGRNPAHIHATIKEPGKTEYWIDEFLFADDPFLKDEAPNKKPKGGDGVIRLSEKDGMLRGFRAIILGLNIDGYPAARAMNMSSGLAIGANCPAFEPFHLSGADKGKNTCPMCKYGYGQGIMVWINHNNLSQLAAFASRLEKEMQEKGEKHLRVFLVYMNPSYRENNEGGYAILKEKLKRWCEENQFQKVALVWVPSPVDKESSRLFKINPETTNTVFLYKKRKVAAKWVNMEYTEENAELLLKKL